MAPVTPINAYWARLIVGPQLVCLPSIEFLSSVPSLSGRDDTNNLIKIVTVTVHGGLCELERTVLIINRRHKERITQLSE